MNPLPVIPWTQGYLAQREGKSDADNPYPLAAVEWLSWRKGWKTAAETMGQPRVTS